MSGFSNLSHMDRLNIGIWLSLAFQSGIINTGGFLACHRFVTHTTGFATLIGVELAQDNLILSLGMLTVPVFFLLGAMISAYFIDHNLLRAKKPRYSVVLFLMTLCMAVITIAGALGFFGSFGEDLILTRDYVLLALLCLASGLQNACITSAFGAVVRTTHLTGTTTDLGIGLVRIISGIHHHTFRQEYRATLIRAGLIGFFILGSFSSFLFQQIKYLGFLIPFMISLSLWIMSLSKQFVPINNKGLVGGGLRD